MQCSNCVQEAALTHHWDMSDGLNVFTEIQVIFYTRCNVKPLKRRFIVFRQNDKDKNDKMLASYNNYKII